MPKIRTVTGRGVVLAIRSASQGHPVPWWERALRWLASGLRELVKGESSA